MEINRARSQTKRQNIVVTEKDIADLEQYETFLKLISSKGQSVDLNFMNESKIKDIPVSAINIFNEELMVCKLEYNYSLVSILTKLTEEYLEPSKIKSFISTEVEWELINEVRLKYPAIKKEYRDNNTRKLF